MAGVANVSEHLSMLLSCYLDGELTTDELAEVVVALETDLDAIAAFRALQETRRGVRLLPTLDMPLHLIPGGHLSEELSAYLDGELSTTEVPVVATHLDSCGDCRRELADLDRSRIAVRALPGVEPPAFLETHRAVVEEKKGRRWPTVAVAGSVAALALVFAMGALGGGTEATSIDLADLQSRHAAVASIPSQVTALEVAGP